MQVVKKGDGTELNELKELYIKVYLEQYKEKLKQQLQQQEKGGFNVLMQAITDKNPEISVELLNSIIKLYKEIYGEGTKEYKQALQTALKTLSKENFTILMSAVKTDNIKTSSIHL